MQTTKLYGIELPYGFELVESVVSEGDDDFDDENSWQEYLDALDENCRDEQKGESGEGSSL
jgi:hypothetical protein